jgi:formate dehydrogenase major subunit
LILVLTGEIRSIVEGGIWNMALSRRQFIKLSVSTSGILATGLGFDMEQAQAEGFQLKIRDSAEYPSICHFCSGGCGIILHVRNDQLVNLEGDPDHPTNKGSLCPKGAALGQVRNNPRRILNPLYRPAGGKEWQEISWDAALDKIARKLKETRDANWIPAANRTDAIGVLGSAELDNEECYLVQKFTRLMGSNYNEHQARV